MDNMSLSELQEAYKRLQLEYHALRRKYLPGVLMVNDQASIRRLIRIVLEKQYYVVEAESAEMAIALLSQSNAPASDQPRLRLALLDVMMPDVGGIELCKMIKQNYAIPVIMCTAVGDLESVRRAKASRVDDYIVKPVTRDALLERVKRWLAPGVE